MTIILVDRNVNTVIITISDARTINVDNVESISSSTMYLMAHC